MPDATTSEEQHAVEQPGRLLDDGQPDGEHRGHRRADRLGEEPRHAAATQGREDPEDDRRADDAGEDDDPAAAGEQRRAGAHRGGSHCRDPAAVRVRRADHRVEPLPGVGDRERVVDHLVDDVVQAGQPGEVLVPRPDDASHGEWVGLGSAVVRDRERAEGHVDVDGAQPVGRGDPQHAGDDVGGRGAGRHQRDAGADRQVDDGSADRDVHPVRLGPHGDRVGRRVAGPDHLAGPATQGVARGHPATPRPGRSPGRDGVGHDITQPDRRGQT